MKMNSVRGVLLTLTALAVTALPAFANIIKTAKATENCTQYTLAVSGILLTPPSATVSYTITLTPSSGSAFSIMDTMTVTKTNKNGNFSGTTTQPWSKYGIMLNADYTLTGTAHLNTSDGNTVNIAFSPNSLNCVVLKPPVIAKTFAPATINVGANSVLSFTISNPNTTGSLSGIGFTDPLPSVVVVATPNGLTGSCGGGTITAVAGSSSVSLSGATLAASASCTFSVNVTGKTAGTATNVTSAVTSNEAGNGNTATAPITVNVGTTACAPSSSSLSILTQGTNVSAYVPNGNWMGTASNEQGVQFVGVEPPVKGTAILEGTNPISDIINSCASNSSTGQSVCVANNTNVYLINGTSANSPITSQSNVKTSFSGGTCNNCGVNINPITNTAAITMGYKSAPSGSAIELLSLANTSNYQILSAAHEVSEELAWDPTRSWILSPDEEGAFEIFKADSTGAYTEYSNVSTEFNSADAGAEDCSTGIGLAPIEYTPNIYIVDLTQATFTAGSPATWSVPSTASYYENALSGFGYWGQSGVTGIAVAGGSHLALVSTEFFGDYFGAIQLPSTSGSGTPRIQDWVSAQMPKTPDGNTWHNGWDPHTSTAYVSPNNGKAYGVLTDAAPPNYIGIVDLAALLAAPRSTTMPHTVDPTYDLVAHGVVTFVATH